MCATMYIHDVYDNMYGSLETILQYITNICFVCELCVSYATCIFISYHHFIDLSIIYTHAHVQLHVMICFIIVIKTGTSTLLTNAIIRSWHRQCPTVRIPVLQFIFKYSIDCFIMKNKNNESCFTRSIKIYKCFIKRSDVIPR